jgi:hypothetical protein
MKKIIYFLLTTEKYTERQENILNSWGNNVDLFFYSEHEDPTRKVLKVCDENNVEIKQISIFKLIKENFYNNYEWYFFGDDDTFVNTKYLNSVLENLNPEFVHGSDIFGCWNDLHYPSGGAGFLIHNSIINNFFDSKNFNVGYGDVTFGLNMKEKNIRIQNNEKFLSQHLDYYKIPHQKANEYLTFHYVKLINELKYFQDICQKSTII